MTQIFHFPPLFLWERDPDFSSTFFEWGNYSIYLHVPYCQQNCGFCVYERRVAKRTEIRQYISGLLAEIKHLRQKNRFNERPQSIFWGGGTPSLLAVEEVLQINEAVAALCGSDAAEVDFEIQPGTLHAADFVRLEEAGVTRVSLAVQSLNEAQIKYMGRRYNRQGVLRDVDHARNAGFETVHADLIFGLPGQSLLDFTDDVRTLSAAGVNHFSAYELITFDETRGWTARSQEPNIALRDFRAAAVDTLGSLGHTPYSCSEYSAPDRKSKYTINRWCGGDYLGIGASAYSRNRSILWRSSLFPLKYSRAASAGLSTVASALPMEPIDRVVRDIAFGLYLLSCNYQRLLTPLSDDASDLILLKLEELEQRGLLALGQGCAQLTFEGQVALGIVMREIVSIPTEILGNTGCDYSHLQTGGGKYASRSND